MWWFKKKEIAAPEPVKPSEKSVMNIKPEAVASVIGKQAREFQQYTPPKGVIPAAIEKAIIAMDSTDYSMMNDAYPIGYGTLDSFPGYPYLAAMAQKPEYRKMVGTIAEEMTRKWIKLKTVGDDDKSERVKQLVDALERFQVREKLKKRDFKEPANLSSWVRTY